MTRISCTVFFEEPFWVAVFERVGEDGRCSAAKTTFGAEPSAREVLGFVQTRFWELSFSAPAAAAETSMTPARINPKRRQREAARATAAIGVGTRAQQALRAQYEAGKIEHRAASREERQAAAEEKFRERQQKKKEKHRGH